jgi:effector-binding domain-containing protein
MIKTKNTINKSSHLTSIKISPTVISFFVKELKEAGGFDELMIIKKALERIDDRYSIITYPNAKDYREKYLTGKYKLLRPYYKTKVPYSFWSQLYIAFKMKMCSPK